MSKSKFSDDFNGDAVHQITVRGYPVSEISKRLGVSTHSLYLWVKKFSKASDPIQCRPIKDILKTPGFYFCLFLSDEKAANALSVIINCK